MCHVWQQFYVSHQQSHNQENVSKFQRRAILSILLFFRWGIFSNYFSTKFLVFKEIVQNSDEKLCDADRSPQGRKIKNIVQKLIFLIFQISGRGERTMTRRLNFQLGAWSLKSSELVSSYQVVIKRAPPKKITKPALNKNLFSLYIVIIA